MSDAAEAEFDLNSLNDEELAEQVHDDLYNGLKAEVEEAVTKAKNDQEEADSKAKAAEEAAKKPPDHHAGTKHEDKRYCGSLRPLRLCGECGQVRAFH